jgi:hypothetical protein
VTSRVYPEVSNNVMYGFRCAACGKWSTKITKPVSHRRFVPADEGPPDLPVMQVVPPVFDHSAGPASSVGGWYVECGPFDTYELRKVTQG